jgi:hypothetical protein
VFDAGAGYGLPTAAVTAAADGQLGLAPDPAGAAVWLGEACAGVVSDPVLGDATFAGVVAPGTVAAGTVAVGTVVAGAVVGVVGAVAAACDVLLHPVSARNSAGIIATNTVVAARGLGIGILPGVG